MMHQKTVPSRVMLILIAVGLVLPMGICLILGLGRLLAAMDDQGPAIALVLDWIGGALGLIWVLDLICLVLASAVNGIGEPSDPA